MVAATLDKLSEAIETYRQRHHIGYSDIAERAGLRGAKPGQMVKQDLFRNNSLRKEIVNWALEYVLPENQLYAQGLTATQVAAVMEMLQGFRRANEMATGTKDSGAPIASANASGAKPPPGTVGARAPQNGAPDPKKEDALRVLGGQLPGKPSTISPGAPPPPATPAATPPKAPGAGPRKPGKPRAYANRSSPRK